MLFLDCSYDPTAILLFFVLARGLIKIRGLDVQDDNCWDQTMYFFILFTFLIQIYINTPLLFPQQRFSIKSCWGVGHFN